MLPTIRQSQVLRQENRLRPTGLQPRSQPSFPTLVWERRPRNSVSRTTFPDRPSPPVSRLELESRGGPRGISPQEAAKRSFAGLRSQTEFGNAVKSPQSLRPNLQKSKEFVFRCEMFKALMRMANIKFRVHGELDKFVFITFGGKPWSGKRDFTVSWLWV